MKKIAELLEKKTPIKVISKPTKRRKDWEDATEFGAYVKIQPKMIMHLFKVYGKARVLALRSWIKDAPHVKPQAFFGLVIWKLKQDLKLSPLASHTDKNPTDVQGIS